uniref:Uncharacterized protein n=1 Tax=Acrobeloides nanus TaxID=290746 RepID=A0A914DJY7_9BILA
MRIRTKIRSDSETTDRDRRKRSRSRSVERKHLRSVEKVRSPSDRKRRSRSREQKHHSRSPLERKRSRSRERKRSRSRDRRRDSESPKRQKKTIAMSRIKISDGNSTLSVSTDRDNVLTLETLKSAFPDAIGLFNPAFPHEKVLMSITDGKISNSDGWDPNAVYLVHNGLRPTSPIPDVKAVSILKSQPLHFDRYKKFLFYAEIYDEDTLSFAPITIIDKTNAVGAYHVFKKFIPKEGEETKLLKIRSQFLDKTFEIKADKYCNGTFCQVILFKAFKPNKFHVRSKDSLIFGPPMIGWPYFTVGYPGETSTVYDGNPINMSYLAGDISSVVQDSHFLGSSGSRPGFSGGPVFSEYAQQLVGFVVGGGPNAKTCGETIDKFEQARYLIASFASLSNPRKWAHGEGCFKASSDVSLGSDAADMIDSDENESMK